MENADRDIYKTQYDRVVQSWASYVAQTTLGGSTLQGVIESHTGPGGKQEQRTGTIAVTNLEKVKGQDVKDAPGVLLIGLTANDGGSLQSSHKLSQPADVPSTRQIVALDNIHIFGLSEVIRSKIQGKISALAFPMVFRRGAGGWRPRRDWER